MTISLWLCCVGMRHYWWALGVVALLLTTNHFDAVDYSLVVLLGFFLLLRNALANVPSHHSAHTYVRAHVQCIVYRAYGRGPAQVAVRRYLPVRWPRTSVKNGRTRWRWLLKTHRTSYDCVIKGARNSNAVNITINQVSRIYLVLGRWPVSPGAKRSHGSDSEVDQ